MPAFGDRFRAERETRGLTLSEVAEQIRIRSVYLAAIEEENWPAIGAPIYVRGFLRTYARFLGLNPEEAVTQFNAQMGNETTDAPPIAPGAYTRDGEERRNLAPLLWGASVVAVLLIAYVVYNALRYSNAGGAAPIAGIVPSPTGSAPIASPMPRASVSGSPQGSGVTPPPGLLSGPHTISVLALAPTWVRLTVDGTVRYEGTLRPGSAQAFRGKTASIRVGNAGGARVTVDGKSLGALGKSGQVIDRTFNL